MAEDALVEFFLLWHRLANIALVPNREDVLVWRWSGAGSVRAAVSEEI
jgi:hypothetical protein